MSLQDALTLLEEDRIHVLLHEIDEKLKRGEKLEDFFGAYLPKQTRSAFQVFIRYMSLVSAIETVTCLAEKKKQKREKLMRGLAYPTGLFIGMCVGILVFNSLIFPSMISLAQGFGVDTQGYVLLRKTTQVLSFASLWSITAALIIALFMFNRFTIVSSYRFLVRYVPNNLLVRKASEDFMMFFVTCHKCGISTQNTLAVLRNLNDSPLVSYIARRLDYLMNEGKDMEFAMKNADVEESLVRIFSIAFHASDFDDMMDSYLAMSEKRTLITIQRISVTVQLLSYSLVGAAVILVYRILSLPLAMISMM